MSNYLKPQSPLKNGENYIYPITTADQIVMDDGTRLNAEISKHLIIDILNANESEPNKINADTLGGYSADEYVRKDQASVEVNYSVVNNLTKPTDEAKFTQNMIWIDTDAPIGRVFFGDNEPNEAFIDDDIWIHTGRGSIAAFNALRIGGNYVNMIYPLNVKQYVSGEWVDKIAKSYRNGEWLDWIAYLYKRGTIGIAGSPGISTDYAGCTLTFESSYIKLNYQGNAYNRGLFPVAIDFTNFSTITLVFSVPAKWSFTNAVQLGVDSSLLTSAPYTAKLLNECTATTSYALTLDVSAYNEISAPWFGIATGGAGENKEIHIHEIILS